MIDCREELELKLADANKKIAFQQESLHKKGNTRVYIRKVIRKTIKNTH